jgi:large subunit ribosomal protein L17
MTSGEKFTGPAELKSLLLKRTDDFGRNLTEKMLAYALGREDSVSHRRLAFDRLRDDKAVGHLFTELGPRFKSRPGGYLRILKIGFRVGDSAPMAIVQLLDQPQKVAEPKEPRTTA